MWEEEFNAIGVSTFTLDGLTGRGLTQVITDQALLGRLNFILDIYRALDVLAKHPRVDSSRIALMGFSRGGHAALHASLTRFHKMWNKSGIGSPLTFRSIQIARPPTSPTPMLPIARSEFLAAHPTITIQSRPARLMWSG